MLWVQRVKNPRMPSGEVQNYSYIQRRPLRITPLRACVMRHRTSPSGKNSAAHQRAQKIWMRCSNAGKLQQPLVSCEIVTSSLEILPRRPSDEAKNCASPCGENVSRTHGLGENSNAVSSCGEKPNCGQWRAAEFLMRGAGGDLISPAGVENIRGGKHRCCLCSKRPERQCADATCQFNLPRR